jgi:probable F420-dependent oxidoreductase
MTRFGLQIMNQEFTALRHVAQMAEGLGFDFVALPDHIVYEGPERQVNPEHLGFDPVMQAAVIAEATTRLRVGHLVLSNLFRHPWFTAQAIVSLDHLSGGRAYLGLGSGWTESEYRMTGIPFPPIAERLRQLDEALTVIRSLWTTERTTFTGEFYRYQDATLFPRSVQRPHPPIVLGGGGKGLLRVAARHADVINIISEVGKTGYIAMANTRLLTEESFLERAAFVRAEAARAGRDPKAIGVSEVVFQTTLTDSPASTQGLLEQMAGMFGLTPDQLRRFPLFLTGTPEECATELKRRIREWDLAEVVFSQMGEDMLRIVGEQILPAVRR